MKFWNSDRLPDLPTEEETKKREEELSKVKIRMSDRFLMVGTAFVCLFLPCILILLGIVFVVMLVFGLL